TRLLETLRQRIEHVLIGHPGFNAPAYRKCTAQPVGRHARYRDKYARGRAVLNRAQFSGTIAVGWVQRCRKMDHQARVTNLLRVRSSDRPWSRFWCAKFCLLASSLKQNRGHLYDQAN